MPLLSSQLSIWEISHRWAGFDPDAFRLGLPLAVRDKARILFDAVLNSEVECHTLQMDKWRSEDGEDQKPYYIRYHLDDIRELIAGKRFSRKLMKWASIERYELHDWCKGHDIPLPEFWFPAGWGLQYNWKREEQELSGEAPREEEGLSSQKGDMRAPARIRMLAQEMAKTVWSESPAMTIADMIRHPDLVKYASAAHYRPDTVRGWLSEVAPEAVKNKRGRPPKKPPSEL